MLRHSKNGKELFYFMDRIQKGDQIEGFETGYFQTPNAIFDKVDYLSIYEKITYIYLCRCSNNGKVAFPSYKTIATKCSFSESQAFRAVKRLIEHGLLQKTNRNKRKSNIYKVIHAEGMLSQSNSHSIGMLSQSKGYALPEQVVCSTRATKKNYSINNYEEEDALLPIAKKNVNKILNQLKDKPTSD
jgi:hypothetical protein